MIHDLKILPEFFEAVCDGTKTFEIRRNDDRTFRVGDILHLREWKDFDLSGSYTGREVWMRVTYVLDASWKLQTNCGTPMCVLAIVPLGEEER